MPMCVGRARAAHVGADVRGEVAAGAGEQRRLERDAAATAPTWRRSRTASRTRRSAPRSWMPACDEAGGDDARSSRRPSRRCARGSSACRPRRARRPGTARASSTPSKKSGALPMTTASMSAQRHLGVVEGARAPPRARGRRSTRRRAWPACLVWPMPTTATRSLAHHSPSSTHTRFCCRHGPDVAWATAAVGVAVGDPVRPPRRCGSGRRPSSGWRRARRPTG